MSIITNYTEIEKRILKKIDNYRYLIELSVDAEDSLDLRLEKIVLYQHKIKLEERFLVKMYLNHSIKSHTIIKDVYDVLGYKVKSAVDDKNYSGGINGLLSS